MRQKIGMAYLNREAFLNDITFTIFTWSLYWMGAI